MHAILPSLLLAMLLACTSGQERTAASFEDQHIDLERVPRILVQRPSAEQLATSRALAKSRRGSLHIGRSLVAIHSQGPVPADLPRCAFGAQHEGNGKLWFVTARGLDEAPQAPGPQYEPYTSYAEFLRAAPDLDGDGVSDLIVSAPGDCQTPGVVFLVSTVTREILYAVRAPAANQRFGTTVCPLPDQDGDGVGDLAIFMETRIEGESYRTRGTVAVFSVATGRQLSTVLREPAGGAYGTPCLEWLPAADPEDAGLIVLGGRRPEDRGVLLATDLESGADAWSLHAETHEERTAWSIAVVEDIDGDGAADLAVGDLGFDESSGSARIRIVSGATGRVIRTTVGTAADHDSGMSIAVYPDLDGDGFDELLVPAIDRIFGGGSLVVISGRDGSALRVLEFTEGFWRIGAAVSVGADWDGKGLPDVCVSSYIPTANDETAFAIGVVSMEDGSLHNYVFSAHKGVVQSTGKLMAKHLDGIRFGRSVLTLSDLDGDGVPEFAVGAPAAAAAGLQQGLVLVFSGAEHEVIQEWRGEQNRSHFGHTLRSAGDVNGDGCQDVLVGYEFAARSEVRSGIDGALLLAFDRSHEELFALGDADRDGSDDLLLQTGDTLEVRSGRDGALLVGKIFAYYDAPLHAVGDLDRDGLTDFVRASETPVLLRSGGDKGKQQPAMSLFHPDGRTPLAELWPTEFAAPGLSVLCVEPAGDLNGDGASDILMTVELERDRTVLGLSLQHEVPLFRLPVGERGGHALASIGDLGGDGTRDFLMIDAPRFCTDVNLSAHSGLDGHRLWRARWSFRQSTLGLSLAILPGRQPGDAPRILAGGSDWNWHGRVSRDGGLRIFEGATGKELWRLDVDALRPAGQAGEGDRRCR